MSLGMENVITMEAEVVVVAPAGVYMLDESYVIHGLGTMVSPAAPEVVLEM